MDKDEVPH